MNCPQCGRPVVCGGCGAAIGDTPKYRVVVLEEFPGNPGTAMPVSRRPDDRTFLVVARGHEDLLAELRRLVGDVGWVRVIEDRRQDQTLLPREGRSGTVRIDEDVES